MNMRIRVLPAILALALSAAVPAAGAAGCDWDAIQSGKADSSVFSACNRDAEHALGNMYYNGIGAAQDPAEGVRWWRKAAEQGDAASQLNLGQAYMEGKCRCRESTRQHVYIR